MTGREAVKKELRLALAAVADNPDRRRDIYDTLRNRSYRAYIAYDSAQNALTAAGWGAATIYGQPQRYVELMTAVGSALIDAWYDARGLE